MVLDLPEDGSDSRCDVQFTTVLWDRPTDGLLNISLGVLRLTGLRQITHGPPKLSLKGSIH